MAVTGIALLASALGITHGSILNTATTFLLPALCLVALPSLAPKHLRILGTFLVWFMLINSLVGIYEKTSGARLFPYLIGAEEKLNDPRPTAWFSHPLNNAVLTAIFLLYLIYGNDVKRNLVLRLAMIAIHGYALICFGGRTAVVALAAILVVDYLVSATRVVLLSGGLIRFARQTLMMAGAIGLGLFATSQGYFNDLIDRFTDDGGSASVRWDAFSLVRDLNVSRILWGYDESFFTSQLAFYGIRTIEFSWLYIFLKHGLFLGAALITSMAYLIFQVARHSPKPAGYMALLLMIVTFGYTSIASASLLISQLVVIVAILHRRTDEHASRPRG